MLYSWNFNRIAHTGFDLSYVITSVRPALSMISFVIRWSVRLFADMDIDVKMLNIPTKNVTSNSGHTGNLVEHIGLHFRQVLDETCVSGFGSCEWGSIPGRGRNFALHH
jgi:hypothetical protein